MTDSLARLSAAATLVTARLRDVAAGTPVADLDPVEVRVDWRELAGEVTVLAENIARLGRKANVRLIVNAPGTGLHYWGGSAVLRASCAVLCEA